MLQIKPVLRMYAGEFYLIGLGAVLGLMALLWVVSPAAWFPRKAKQKKP